jgi:peptidoglycan/LPS O-acetylase OafA/YrhL
MDQVKGLAILSVICIHAKVFEGTVLHGHLVNRAVPVLLILFGFASELSWRRMEARGVAQSDLVRRWYRRRLSRLLPGMWAALAACIAFQVLVTGHTPTAGEVLGAIVGYAPQFGTSWFIIVILQVVVLYPFVRGTLVRSGPVAMLVFGALVSGTSVWGLWDVVAAGKRWLGADQGFYYHWIFAPRVLFHVVAGMAMVAWGHRVRRGALVACGALVLAGPLLVAGAEHLTRDPFRAPLLGQLVLYALDVPLVLLLLWGVGTRLMAGAGDTLSWLGRHTWGLYLGQMVFFELAHVVAYFPEEGPRVARIVYALALLGGGVALTLAANVVRTRVGASGPGQVITESRG